MLYGEGLDGTHPIVCFMYTWAIIPEANIREALPRHAGPVTLAWAAPADGWGLGEDELVDDHTVIASHGEGVLLGEPFAFLKVTALAARALQSAAHERTRRRRMPPLRFGPFCDVTVSKSLLCPRVKTSTARVNAQSGLSCVRLLSRRVPRCWLSLGGLSATGLCSPIAALTTGPSRPWLCDLILS